MWTHMCSYMHVATRLKVTIFIYAFTKNDDPEFDDSSSASENDNETYVSSIIHMITVFLLKWKYMFNISDNALSVLIKFFNKVIFIIIKVTKTKEDMNKFTRDIPNSLYYTLRKLTGLNKKYFKTYTRCPRCHSINSNLHEKTC